MTNFSYISVSKILADDSLTNWPMRLTTNKALQAGIIVIVLAIVAVLFVSIRQSQRVRDTSNLVSHTQEVLFHIQRVVLFGLDNETGARGFALTADNKFLEPVTRSKKDIYDELNLLRKLISDNPVQKVAIDSLNIYLDKRVEYSEQTIILRQQKGLDAAVARIKTGVGKYYTDQIRRIGSSMQEEENGLLEKRKKRNEQNISQLSLLLYSTLAVVFALGIYIINRVGADMTRQKQAEEKVRESEQLFSTLFYKSPIMKAIAEAPSVRYIDVNDAYAEFLGYPKTEIIGKTSLELKMLVHPDERVRILHELEKNDFVRNAETQLRAKDGTERWISTSIDKLSLYGKECYLIALIDITDRKLFEKKLLKLSQELEQKVQERTQQIKESEKRYRYLFENNPMPMWVIDLETFRFLDVNEMAVLQYGYSRKEFLSMTALDIRPEKEVELFKQSDHSFDGNAANYRKGVWNHRKKDGTIILAEIIAHEIIFDGKQARFILSNDITEKRKAEEKLIRSEELYRSLFENMLHGFAYCRAIFEDDRLQDYVYLAVNSEYESITGLKDITGKKVSEVMPGLLAADPEYAAIITRVLLTGKPEKFETWVAALGKWLSISLYSPEHGYFVGLADNITERKLAEQRGKRLNEELEKRVVSRTEELRKSNDELEAFSYSVSHDLRAPLRGIIGFSAMLEEDYGPQLDDGAKRVIAIIKNNTSRMGQLIDDLLGFSRMSRHNIVKTDINTAAMVSEIVQEMDDLSRSPRIDWVIHPLPGVRGDANIIRQVWINLISNAVKYSKDISDPRIEIGSFPSEGNTGFFVRDNGVGFDAQYTNKLFKVFQRLHSAQEFEGTGVGLAIVEKIISKHGGKVWAEAEVGKGATFYFNLPAT